MEFKHLINNYRESINSELKNIYESGPKIIKEPIYHVLKGGKRIRPILCLITSAA